MNYEFTIKSISVSTAKAIKTPILASTTTTTITLTATTATTTYSTSTMTTTSTSTNPTTTPATTTAGTKFIELKMTGYIFQKIFFRKIDYNFRKETSLL